MVFFILYTLKGLLQNAEALALILYLVKLFRHSFLHGNRYCNRCSHHRVVALQRLLFLYVLFCNKLRLFLRQNSPFSRMVHTKSYQSVLICFYKYFIKMWTQRGHGSVFYPMVIIINNPMVNLILSIVLKL